jgi:hypothetical protein
VVGLGDERVNIEVKYDVDGEEKILGVQGQLLALNKQATNTSSVFGKMTGSMGDAETQMSKTEKGGVRLTKQMSLLEVVGQKFLKVSKLIRVGMVAMTVEFGATALALVSVNAAFNIGIGLVKLYKWAMQGLAGTVAAVGAAVLVGAAAFRQFSAATAAYNYKDSKVLGSSLSQSSNMMRQMYKDTELASFGIKALSQAFAAASQSAQVDPKMISQLKQMSDFAAAGPDPAKGLASAATFLGLLKKYKTFNKEVRGALGQVSPELDRLVKKGQVPTDAQTFLDQLQSGELAKKAGVSGANANIKNTLFGNFKALLSDAYTEIADSGQRLLAPVQDAMNKIYFGLRNTFRKVSNDLVAFGNGGLIGALTSFADKVEQFSLKLFRTFLPQANGWWKRTGDVFKSMVNDFKDARDMFAPMRKGGSEVIHMFGAPIVQVFKSLRENMQHLADVGVKNAPKFKAFGESLANVVEGFFAMGRGFKDAFTTALPVLTRIVNVLASLMQVIGTVLGGMSKFGSAGGTAAVLGGMYLAHKGKTSMKSGFGRGAQGQLDSAYGIKEVTKQSQIGNGLPFTSTETDLPNSPLSGASGQMSAALQPSVTALSASSTAQNTASAAMELAASSMNALIAGGGGGTGDRSYGSSQFATTGNVATGSPGMPGGGKIQMLPGPNGQLVPTFVANSLPASRRRSEIRPGSKGYITPYEGLERSGPYKRDDNGNLVVTGKRVGAGWRRRDFGKNQRDAKAAARERVATRAAGGVPNKALGKMLGKQIPMFDAYQKQFGMVHPLDPRVRTPVLPNGLQGPALPSGFVRQPFVKPGLFGKAPVDSKRYKFGSKYRTGKAGLSSYLFGTGMGTSLGGSGGSGVTGAFSSSPVTGGVNQGLFPRMGRKFFGQTTGTDLGGGKKGALARVLGLGFGGDGQNGRTSAFQQGYLAEKEKFKQITGLQKMTAAGKFKAVKGGLKNSMTGLGGIGSFAATSLLDTGFAKKHIDPKVMPYMQAGAGLMAINPMLGAGVGLAGYAANAKTTKGGAMAGAASGAALGAAAASFIPGVGTVAGALVGAGVGAVVGFMKARGNQKKFAKAGAIAVVDQQAFAAIYKGLGEIVKSGTTVILRKGIADMKNFSAEFGKVGQTAEGRAKLLSKYKKILTPDQLKEMTGGISHGGATRQGVATVAERSDMYATVMTRSANQFDDVMKSLRLSTGMTAEEINNLALKANVNLFNSELKLTDITAKLGVGMLKTGKQFKQALRDVGVDSLKVFDDFTKAKDMTDAVQSAGDALRGGSTSPEAFIDYYTKVTDLLNFKNPDNPIANFLKRSKGFSGGEAYGPGGALRGVKQNWKFDKLAMSALGNEQTDLVSNVTSQIGGGLTGAGFNFNNAEGGRNAVSSRVAALFNKAKGGDKAAEAQLLKLQDTLSKTDVAGNAINPFSGAKTAAEASIILETILNGAGYYTAKKSGKNGALFDNQTINPEIAGKKSPGQKTDLEKEIESGFLAAIDKGLMDTAKSPQWWDNAPKWWESGLALKYKDNDPSKEVIGLQPPQLANGGIIMPRRGGTLVNVGEAGRAEAVVPLNDPRGAALMSAATLRRAKTSTLPASSATTGGSATGDTNINVTIHESGNPRDTAHQVLQVLQAHAKNERRRK